MIDEKRLDEMVSANADGPWDVPIASKEEWEDLLRLAFLGLWSQKHGIPAVEFYSKSACGSCAIEYGGGLEESESEFDEGKLAKQALEKLPKSSSANPALQKS